MIPIAILLGVSSRLLVVVLRRLAAGFRRLDRGLRLLLFGGCLVALGLSVAVPLLFRRGGGLLGRGLLHRSALRLGRGWLLLLLLGLGAGA